MGDGFAAGWLLGGFESGGAEGVGEWPGGWVACCGTVGGVDLPVRK
jgi:hypothetical protein